MTKKDEFIEVYRQNIHRAGAEELLAWLTSPQSDFFTAPASTRYHGSHPGGLCEHSLNVYHCLKDYLERPAVRDTYGMNDPKLYTPETIAVVSLLHDLCKVNCYRESQRNVKGPDGKWTSVPYYEFDDQLPYGHGEKSVYIATGFMRLERHEAFAIRYHMGFSVEGDARNVGAAFEKFPLAMALFIADMEATYYLEGKK